MEFEFYEKRYGFPLECMTFYDKMTSYERYLHLNDKNLKDYYTIDIFFQLLHSHIYEWDNELKQFIIGCENYLNNVINNLNIKNNLDDVTKVIKISNISLLLNLWNSNLTNENNKKIQLILVSDDLEFGLPFTLKNYIFIPFRIVYTNYRLENYKRIAEILFHEKIHILQRQQIQENNLFTKLSQQLGYIFYDKQYPQFIYKSNLGNFVNNYIQNPDTFEHGVWFYNNKKTEKLYFYILYVDKPRTSKQSIKRKSYVYDLKLKYWSIDKTNFIPFQNKYRQYEHPYELIAELFTKMIFDLVH
jgi:hypothetical protein